MLQTSVVIEVLTLAEDQLMKCILLAGLGCYLPPHLKSYTYYNKVQLIGNNNGDWQLKIT